MIFRNRIEQQGEIRDLWQLHLIKQKLSATAAMCISDIQ